MTIRVAPLEPPYESEADGQLRSMMPPGVEPIALFRTFAKNLPMAAAMQPWGRYLLGKNLSVGVRDREIVIDRTCARCGCEYEWGVHVAFFAERAALTPAQITSLTHGQPVDSCWETERDRLLIRLADAVHDDGDVTDGLWEELTAVFDEAQLLDLVMVCGWYHAISFTAKVARVPLEPGAPTFRVLVAAAASTVLHSPHDGREHSTVGADQAGGAKNSSAMPSGSRKLKPEP
jgi:alkylhydroperoxidase family enzyme